MTTVKRTASRADIKAGMNSLNTSRRRELIVALLANVADVAAGDPVATAAIEAAIKTIEEA